MAAICSYGGAMGAAMLRGGLVIALLLIACDPGVCRANTTQMVDRCIVNPDGGMMAQASRAMPASQHARSRLKRYVVPPASR